MTDEQLINHPDLSFKYQMLGRLQSDCNYYIGCNGGVNLWGITVESHLKTMKKLWKSLPKGGKPVWLRYKELEKLEKEMREIAKRRIESGLKE